MVDPHNPWAAPEVSTLGRETGGRIVATRRARLQTLVGCLRALAVGIIGMPLGGIFGIALFRCTFALNSSDGDCGTLVVNFILLGLVAGFFGGVFTAVALPHLIASARARASKRDASKDCSGELSSTVANP
jgi:hypothetical protein